MVQPGIPRRAIIMIDNGVIEFLFAVICVLTHPKRTTHAWAPVHDAVMCGEGGIVAPKEGTQMCASFVLPLISPMLGTHARDSGYTQQLFLARSS